MQAVRITLTRAQTRRSLRRYDTRREKLINTAKWLTIAALAVTSVIGLVVTSGFNTYGI